MKWVCLGAHHGPGNTFTWSTHDFCQQKGFRLTSSYLLGKLLYFHGVKFLFFSFLLGSLIYPLCFMQYNREKSGKLQVHARDSKYTCATRWESPKFGLRSNVEVRLCQSKQTEIVMRSQKGAKKEIRRNTWKMRMSVRKRGDWTHLA